MEIQYKLNEHEIQRAIVQYLVNKFDPEGTSGMDGSACLMKLDEAGRQTQDYAWRMVYAVANMSTK